MRHRAPHRQEQGLTLVELMVTVLLAGILTAGLFYMTTGQTRTYRSQLNRLTAQERAWGAIEYLARQVRMAGYGFGGCPAPGVMKWNGSGDAVELADGGVAIEAFNDCDLFAWATANPTDWPPNDVSTSPCTGGGIDGIAIAYSRGTAVGAMPGVRISEDMPSSSANLKMQSCIGVHAGDIVVLWDPSQPLQPCTMIKVTHDPADPTKPDCKLQHGPEGEYNPPGGHNIFPPGGYKKGALAINYGASGQPMKFAIDRTDPRHPKLVQWSNSNNPTSSDYDLQVIADGIEDMQITWGCDADANGVTQEGPSLDSDEMAHNGTLAGDTVPVCNASGTIKPVNLVRITLVARTLSPEPGFNTGYRPGAEDRPEGPKTGVGSDKDLSGGVGTYGRAVVSMTVKPRNINEAPAGP